MQNRKFEEEVKLFLGLNFEVLCLNFEVLDLNFERDSVAVEAINQAGVGKGESGSENTTTARQSSNKMKNNLKIKVIPN